MHFYHNLWAWFISFVFILFILSVLLREVLIIFHDGGLILMGAKSLYLSVVINELVFVITRFRRGRLGNYVTLRILRNTVQKLILVLFSDVFWFICPSIIFVYASIGNTTTRRVNILHWCNRFLFLSLPTNHIINVSAFGSLFFLRLFENIFKFRRRAHITVILKLILPRVFLYAIIIWIIVVFNSVNFLNFWILSF